MTDTSNPFYISTIASDAENIARKYGLGLEIAEFCTASNMDSSVGISPPYDMSEDNSCGFVFGFEANDKLVRDKMRDVGQFVFHAPFNELCPAAIEPLIVDVAKKRYAQAYEVMTGYGIEKMVAHSGFVPQIYFPEWFVEKSVAFWQEFLSDKPKEFRLYLENVLEDSPDMLIEIAEKVNDERFRLCFDIGHAGIMGKSIPITEWANRMLPFLAHVHLHNNHGKRDTHNALYDGAIDVASVISMLRNAAPKVTYTLEVINADESAKWLKSNGYI